MKASAILLLIDQSLKLHRKGKLDEEDCLASIRGALGVGEALVREHDPDLHRGMRARSSAYGAPPPLAGDSLFGRFVPVNAPFDIDNPDAAMIAMCGPLLRDYKRGAVSGAPDSDMRKTVMEQVMRRDVDIRNERQRLLDLAARGPDMCPDCGEPSTVSVMGVNYCAAHAEAHKPERPALVAEN